MMGWPTEPLHEWSADERVDWVFHRPDEAQHTPREEAMLALRDADVAEGERLGRIAELEKFWKLGNWVEDDVCGEECGDFGCLIHARLAELREQGPKGG